MADKNMNAKISVDFEESASRQSLNSGDSLPTLFGKVKKFFSDLKTVAFSGSYNDLTDLPEKFSLTCTFLADNWTETAPYTQTITVSQLTAAHNPDIDIIISDNIETGRKEELAYNYLTKITTGDGTLTALCYNYKPDIDLNLLIEVR